MDGLLDEVDEADAALESFMQEDALLDAIQNAPQVGALVQTFEVDAGALPGGPGAGAPAPRPQVNSTIAPAFSSSSASASSGMARREAAAPDRGPKERRHDATAELRPAAGQPPEAFEVADPRADPEAKTHAAKPRSLPWGGALLTASALLGIFVWGPALWEEEVKSPSKMAVAAYAEPRPIQMPAPSDDDAAAPGGINATSVNVTALSARRGSIGVRWSSGSAVNASMLGAFGNSSALAAAAAEPPRGEHGRRGRVRGKAGGSELR